MSGSIKKFKQIFISFSSEDREYADIISRYLLKYDISVWLNSRSLIPGTPDWDTAIKDTIKRSGVVLYLASPHSVILKRKWFSLLDFKKYPHSPGFLINFNVFVE